MIARPIQLAGIGVEGPQKSETAAAPGLHTGCGPVSDCGARKGRTPATRTLRAFISICSCLAGLLCLTPAALADWKTGPDSVKVAGPIFQAVTQPGVPPHQQGERFVQESFNIDYQGGTAVVAGSADGTAS